MNLEQLVKLQKLLCEDTKAESPCCDSGQIRIVILQRGWIAVGRFYQQGDEGRLEKAAIIRTWGTKRGLGEIAEDGPTSNTVLDTSPTIRFHMLSVVASIDCSEKKWEKHLK